MQVLPPIGRSLAFLRKSQKRSDTYDPRMPDVDGQVDIAELFARVRATLSCDPPRELECFQPGVAIVSPDRSVSVLRLPASTRIPQRVLDNNRIGIPYTNPLNITAVSFTGVCAPKLADVIRNRMVFLAGILPFAHNGHRIVVFEGHESGFEAALKDADVLIIDSAMLPLLQSNWFDVARGIFRYRGRIRIFDRKTMDLSPAVPSKSGVGWTYAAEPDGERSYISCMMEILANRPPMPVQLWCDEPLPDLRRMAITPEEIEWTTELPFDYGALSVEEAMRQISEVIAGMNWPPAPEGEARAFWFNLIEEGGGTRKVYMKLLVFVDGLRGRSLKMERLLPTT